MVTENGSSNPMPKVVLPSFVIQEGGGLSVVITDVRPGGQVTCKIFWRAGNIIPEFLLQRSPNRLVHMYDWIVLELGKNRTANPRYPLNIEKDPYRSGIAVFPWVGNGNVGYKSLVSSLKRQLRTFMGGMLIAEAKLTHKDKSLQSILDKYFYSRGRIAQKDTEFLYMIDSEVLKVVSDWKHSLHTFWKSEIRYVGGKPHFFWSTQEFARVVLEK